MPAYWVADALGIEWSNPWHRGIFLLAYCLALALLLDAAMRWAGRRRGEWRRIGHRTASLAAAAFGAAVIGFFALRYAQWIDFPALPDTADDVPFALREHASQISDVALYEIPGGFLDREYDARVRAEPGLLPALVGSLAREPVPPDRVPPEFWTAPAAWWWDPPRAGAFYATRDFPRTDRGRDGDHYLLLSDPDGALWVWLKQNF